MPKAAVRRVDAERGKGSGTWLLPRSSFIEVTPISTAADTVAATGAVVAAVATGAISPEEGQAVAGVIEFQRRAIETNDLAARIEALERGAGRP